MSCPCPRLWLLAALACLLVGGLVSPALAKGKRFAVLAGVKEYEHPRFADLRYPENDVTDLAELLRTQGYEVVLLCDSAGKKDAKYKPTRANIEREVRTVLRSCGGGDLVLVALSGHGLQFPGKDAEHYFCPADARPFADATETLVPLGDIYKQMDRSFAGVKVLLVDACREEPGAPGSSKGLDGDNARPPRGVLALFSCSAGERSFESEKVKHGVFFHFVLEGLRGDAPLLDGEVTFANLSGYVRGRVSREVGTLVGGGARQSPALVADSTGESSVLTTLAPVPAAEDLETRLHRIVPDATGLVVSGNSRRVLGSRLFRDLLGADGLKTLRDALADGKGKTGIDFTKDMETVGMAILYPERADGEARLVFIARGDFDMPAIEGKVVKEARREELAVGIGKHRTSFVGSATKDFTGAMLFSPKVLLFATDKELLEETCRKISRKKTTEVADADLRAFLNRPMGGDDLMVAGVVPGIAGPPPTGMQWPKAFHLRGRVAEDKIPFNLELLYGDAKDANQALSLVRAVAGLGLPDTAPESVKKWLPKVAEGGKVTGTTLSFSGDLPKDLLADLIRAASAPAPGP